MNCKPGDLAVVVRSEMGNQGRIVRVVRPARPGEVVSGVLAFPDDDWIVESRLLVAEEQVLSWRGVAFARFEKNRREVTGLCPFPDSFLRPIRDQDGEDETLSWASKPSEVTA